MVTKVSQIFNLTIIFEFFETTYFYKQNQGRITSGITVVHSHEYRKHIKTHEYRKHIKTSPYV